MLEQSLGKCDCLFCQFGGKVFHCPQKLLIAERFGHKGTRPHLPQEHENLIRHYFTDARSVCQQIQLLGKAFVFHQFVP